MNKKKKRGIPVIFRNEPTFACTYFYNLILFSVFPGYLQCLLKKGKESNIRGKGKKGGKYKGRSIKVMQVYEIKNAAL